MNVYCFISICLFFFFSCTEKKKNTISNSHEPFVLTHKDSSAKKSFCLNGNLPSVLDSATYPPIVLEKEKDSRTFLYILKSNDSVTVKVNGCENPSYEYTYSTKRYYRGIDEVRFYYGAVNSFYLMLEKEHHPQTYLHNDLIEASKSYLVQHKKVTLQYPIPFTSQGKNWTYTLEALEMNGERRTMRWSIRCAN